MIDYETYDPSKDATGSELCNSLNYEAGYLRNQPSHTGTGGYIVTLEKDRVEAIADYMERAQQTIAFLQGLTQGQDVAIDNLQAMCKALASHLNEDTIELTLKDFLNKDGTEAQVQ